LVPIENELSRGIITVSTISIKNVSLASYKSSGGIPPLLLPSFLVKSIQFSKDFVHGVAWPPFFTNLDGSITPKISLAAAIIVTSLCV